MALFGLYKTKKEKAKEAEIAKAQKIEYAIKKESEIGQDIYRTCLDAARKNNKVNYNDDQPVEGLENIMVLKRDRFKSESGTEYPTEIFVGINAPIGKGFNQRATWYGGDGFGIAQITIDLLSEREQLEYWKPPYGSTKFQNYETELEEFKKQTHKEIAEFKMFYKRTSN
jgi:hypothetical protein